MLHYLNIPHDITSAEPLQSFMIRDSDTGGFPDRMPVFFDLGTQTQITSNLQIAA